MSPICRHCTPLEGCYTKDLRALGRPLRSTILVENTPLSYCYQPANAILVPTWTTDDADVELCALVDLLEQCAACHDVRPVLTRHCRMEELMQAWQMSSLAESKEVGGMQTLDDDDDVEVGLSLVDITERSEGDGIEYGQSTSDVSSGAYIYAPQAPLSMAPSSADVQVGVHLGSPSGSRQQQQWSVGTPMKLTDGKPELNGTSVTSPHGSRIRTPPGGRVDTSSFQTSAVGSTALPASLKSLPASMAA